MISQYNIQCDKENGHANDRHHHHPYTHTRTKQLVMEMILIGQERVTMITKAMKHHTDYIEQRDQDRGESDHHIGIWQLR